MKRVFWSAFFVAAVVVAAALAYAFKDAWWKATLAFILYLGASYWACLALKPKKAHQIGEHSKSHMEPVPFTWARVRKQAANNSRSFIGVVAFIVCAAIGFTRAALSAEWEALGAGLAFTHAAFVATILWWKAD